MEPDTERALSFLSFIFAEADEGYVNLFSVDRTSGQRRTAWAPVEDLPRLGNAITDFGRKGDVWFGCALRREVLPNGQRGGINECLAIPGLWLDVDVAGTGHRLNGLATSIDQARLFLKRWPESPDAVVRSGYGLQLWWRFREVLDAEQAVLRLARWRLTWLRHAAAEGIHIDDVWDLPRVMRLPGTFNFKGESPVMVTVKWREA
jgi:putative DNA primase/helicase